MTKIPVIPLRFFTFNKELKSLSVPSEYYGMPSAFWVESEYTGRKVKMVPVQPGHPFFDQDGWDGEQMVYVPEEPLPNVEKVIIYNTY